MSNDRKDYKLYLIDIESSCSKIIKYTKGKSKLLFVNDQKTIDAVVRNLEIIGEASNKIPVKIQKETSEVNWKDVIGMRNKLIHEYFDLKIDIIWGTVVKDIPVLKKQVNRVLKDLGSKQLKLKK